jgi:hypothetical protein
VERNFRREFEGEVALKWNSSWCPTGSLLCPTVHVVIHHFTSFNVHIGIVEQCGLRAGFLHVSLLRQQETLVEGLSEQRISCPSDEKDAYLYYLLLSNPGRTLVRCCFLLFPWLLDLVKINAPLSHESIPSVGVCQFDRLYPAADFNSYAAWDSASRPPCADAAEVGDCIFRWQTIYSVSDPSCPIFHHHTHTHTHTGNV